MDKKIRDFVLRKMGKIAQIGIILTVCSAVAVGQDRMAQVEMNSMMYKGVPISQDVAKSAVLNKIISISVQDLSLLGAVEKIAEKANLEMVYNSKLLAEKNRSITVNLKQVTVEEAMWTVLEETNLRFAVSADKQLVLLKQKEAKNSLQRIAAATQETITGTVTDGQSGETLPGVNILVKGTTTGASTDQNGNFELTVPSLQDTLMVSFIGYQTKEVPIEGRTEVDVVLNSQAIAGEELVVVGYGVQRRETLTGSITDVSGTELASSPTVSLSNTFAGRLPGVSAMNRSGEPGEDVSDLLIRGRSTLGNNDPLVVIDGVAGRQGLNQIDPDDIESISVLKDASAAIYGAQAANGVILINTKRGSVSSPDVTYNYEFGINQPTRLPEMGDAASYAQFYNDLLAQRNEAPRFTSEEIQKFRDGTDPENYPNTDWVDETLKDFSTQDQHTLSIGGGTDRVRYYLSGNYKNQNSIFKNGITDFKTGGFRGNFNINVSDRIEVTVDVSAQQQNRTRPSVSTGAIMNSMWRNYPFLKAWHEEGIPGAGIERGENPVVMVTDAAGYRDDKSTLYQTKFGTSIDVPELPGLTIDGYLAIDRDNGNNTRWRTPWTVYNYDSETDTYEEQIGGPIAQPDLRKESQIDKRWTANTKITYQRDFKEHMLEAFVAGEYTENSYEYFYAQRRDFVSEALDQLFAGSSANQTTDGTFSEVKRGNIIGRVSYNFSEKYLVDANFRYDGSSIFPKGNRWGFFPGISAAWRISEESFLQREWIDDIKLRTSWGILGNDRVPANQHLATYNFTTGAFFGSDQAPNIGLASGVEPNPNITWEEARSLNIGLDAELWNGGLGVSLDLFETRRTNILTSRNVSVPDYTGLSLPDENIGIVENRGFEIEISHRKVREDFNYMAGVNLGYARNEVIHIDEPAGVIDHQRREGNPLGSRLLYLNDGIFESQGEIENYPSLSNAIPGDLKLIDVNGDGVISSEDRVRMDETPTPKLTFGFNANLGYKNFDLSMLWQGATKARQYFQLQSGLSGNMLQEILDHRYTEDNPNPKYPNIGSSNLLSSYASDFWFLDASFIRLKEITLNYSIPSRSSSIIGIDDVSFYLSGRNLLTFAYTDWFDPEGLSGTERRKSFYPPNRTFTFGIKVGI